MISRPVIWFPNTMRRYTSGKRDLRLTRSPRADEVRRRLDERDARICWDYVQAAG